MATVVSKPNLPNDNSSNSTDWFGFNRDDRDKMLADDLRRNPGILDTDFNHLFGAGDRACRLAAGYFAFMNFH